MCEMQGLIIESLPGPPRLQHLPLHIIKNKFNTKDRGAPKSARPVAIATFASIVNPALPELPLCRKSNEQFLAYV